MNINLLTIVTIASAAISIIVVICIILVAKWLKRVLTYIRDWRLSENMKKNTSWTCTKCGGWNVATEHFCEDCGKLGNPSSPIKT